MNELNSAASPEALRQRIRQLEERLEAMTVEQRKVRGSEARFKLLSELISDCCWARWTSADSGETRLWVNDSFETLTGYSPKEFEVMGRAGLVHPEDLERARARVEGPLGESELEFRILRKDGEVRWLHERMLVQEEPHGGHLVLGATRDITAQKQAEEVLHNAHSRLEQEVQRRTRELAAEVAERRRIAEALHQAKERAESSSRAKSEFLANISHELRTPVHGIIGLCGLIAEEQPPGPGTDYVELLRETATSLHQVLHDVLDLSKVELAQVVEDLERPVGREPAPAASAEHTPRVLVAEDQQLNQLVLRRQLESLDLEVQVVENGAQAVAAVSGGSFDLVLMDCRMPGVDGYEAVRRIRSAEDPGSRVPVVAITANAIREQIDACFEAGMDDVLTKPYRQEDLNRLLRAWLPRAATD